MAPKKTKGQTPRRERNFWGNPPKKNALGLPPGVGKKPENSGGCGDPRGLAIKRGGAPKPKGAKTRILVAQKKNPGGQKGKPPKGLIFWARGGVARPS